MAQEETIKVGATTRKMIVYVPSGIEQNRPLVISMHGMNQTMNDQKNQTQFQSVAQANNFVLVFPQSEGSQWQLWGDNDINFILAIIDEMNMRYGIDRDRVYLTGFSMGGMMSYYAATRIADKIAAFAPVSGFLMGGPNTNSSRPVPIIHVHGADDGYVPHSRVQECMDAWIIRNGCPTTPVVTKPYPENQLNSQSSKKFWGPGDEGVELVFISVAGVGHWYSDNPNGIFTSQEIWNFCKRFSLKDGVPEFRYASVTDKFPSQIQVELSKSIVTAEHYYGFTVKIDGIVADIESVVQCDSNKLAINLEFNILKDNEVSLSYNNGNVVSVNYEKKLINFSDISVDNLLKGAAPKIMEATTDTSGDALIIKFNKKMQLPANDPAFELNAEYNGQMSIPVLQSSFFNNDSTMLSFLLGDKVYRDYKLSVAFSILFSIHLIGNAQKSQSNQEPKRDKENFDSNWQFHKGDIAMKQVARVGQGGITDINVPVISKTDTLIDYTNFESSMSFFPPDWKAVNLPHDWAIEGDFVADNTLGSQPGGSGYLPTGIGFYRKEFVIPESEKGRKISIEFDGIFRNSTVWVNGHLMGTHLSGYTPSNYDLTDVLRYGNEGKNAILVKVDATQAEGWWYEGAGIYRHVWLVKTDKLHVARFGTFVTTPVITDAEAGVSIKTTLINGYKTAKNVSLISKIVDTKGSVLDVQTSTQSIAPFEQIEIAQMGAIKSPKLWSPETPALYKLLTEVSEAGNIVDTYETTFGVRTVEINKDGVFLNGKLYPVKGTCNHQDFAGLGVALPDKINWYKLKLLKESGSNGYRTHHPSTPELLHMCDSMGMLVLAENRHLSSSEDGIKDLTTMLLRDRNHPSVFMWSMENEEAIQGTVMGARILETLVETSHRIDPTRKVTAAMNKARNDAGYSDILDVVGYNYGDKQLAYVADKEKYPDRVMFCTEGTSFVSTRGEYKNSWWPQTCSNSIIWQPNWGPYPGEDWADIVKYPYLGGLFVWTGFDYRGEPTPFIWPGVSSQFGFMDLCGFPKDGYYAYKAAWTDIPVVHIFPHWNWPGKEGDSLNVHCYTNCNEVELFLNGQSLGRQKAEPYKKLIWPAIYKPGKLEAKGYTSGKLVVTDIVETTLAPAQVAASSDVATLKANGCDVAVIRVAIKDANGRVVPTADNLVKFDIEGPGKIIGVGNGNPKSHEPDKASQRMAFNGYCMVLVQSEKQTGQIKLKALSDDLNGAEVVINTRK